MRKSTTNSLETSKNILNMERKTYKRHNSTYENNRITSHNFILTSISPNVMYYLVWIGSVSGGFGYWRSEIFFVGGSLCNAVAF